MTKTKTSTENFLDFVPVKNPDYHWVEKDSGMVVVTIPHNGFFDKLAQLLFHKPPHSYIDLDAYGSFIWQLIDAQRSVYDISLEVLARFGDDAQPLHNRLCAFFQILRDHRFIVWKKQD